MDELPVIMNLKLSEIFADVEFNCRQEIDPITVIELAKDIKANGLTQPITVQPWYKEDHPEYKYRIVAGYRRFKAHQINKAETIMCIVRNNLTDIQARVLNLSENLHRQDLNIKQEAMALQKLYFAGLTEGDVAKQLGKSRGWVQIRFFLLELPEDIQNEAAAGVLTQAQVRDVWRLPSYEQQIEFVKQVKDKKILGKKREVTVEAIIKPEIKRIRSREEIFSLQENIQSVFGNNMATKVLAWAAGEISGADLSAYMQTEAHKIGRIYI